MLAGLVIGVIGFQFIFEQINKLDFKVINKVQEKTRAFRNKTKLQYGIMIILTALLWVAMQKVGINSILQGLMIGVLWAFIMFVFEDTIFDSMRNTLR